MAATDDAGGDLGLPPIGARLREALRPGRFAVTAELTQPRGTDLTKLRRGAAQLHDYVDAVNFTDNPSAIVRLASWAAAVAVMAEGLEPVCQLQCRDRNRIALQSDLLGIAAVGVPNVLLLTGDHTRFGDHPEAKDVFDLDSVDLVWTAATMCESGELLSGHRLQGAPKLLVGAAENPSAPPTAFRARRLAKKAKAGARFVQTQYVFDVPTFRRFVAEAADLGALDECRLIAGVGPIRSPRSLARLRTGIPGIVVPDEVAHRFDGVAEADFPKVGIELCAETVAELHDIDGVAGVHLMAFAWEESIPEILERAGLSTRAQRGFPS